MIPREGETMSDAPQVEPLALTLEEALRLLAEKRGTTLAYHVGDGSPDDPSGWVEAETGTLLGDYGRWEDAASFGLGVPVERRDDTAELARENAELRRILSECVAAAGGAATPTCSLEFFAAVPREIELVRRKDTAELVAALEAVARAEYDSGVGEYAMTVATMRCVRAALARVKGGGR